VDRFKDYNDAHGHLMGDSVLQTVSKILLGSVRKSDVVARYGGEEFVVLLPEVGLEYGLQIAEGLRVSIAGTSFQGCETRTPGIVTASFGVSVYPEDGTDPSDLIRKADHAMYEAKKAGRNCVRTASGRLLSPGTIKSPPGPGKAPSSAGEVP
jgi:diguanylate cyclase (GGDEF)-like protein